MIEASKYVNGCVGSITNCCRGRIKTCYGFVWKYTPIENLSDEIWKEISQFPTYFISTKGRLKHVIKDNEFLIQGSNIDGYLTVCINNLICTIFKGPKPENHYVVNHIDVNRLNNNIDNLEWVTSSENTKHAYSMNLVRSIKINQIGKSI